MTYSLQAHHILQAHDSQEALSAELVDLCGESPIAGDFLSIFYQTASQGGCVLHSYQTHPVTAHLAGPKACMQGFISALDGQVSRSSCPGKGVLIDEFLGKHQHAPLVW